MNVKTKYTSSFLQANSPTFYTQASTEMKSPGLASLSSFNAGKVLNSPSAASPERRLAKSDIIYVSRTELERELHGFVEMLVQDKAVNENDTTQYLEHLKRLVINLIKENTRLQSTPRSARLLGSESPYGSPKDTTDVFQKLEEFEKQKMIYEEKIKSHSLYILKLEDKVDDLVKQCHGLMKINYELSDKIGQIPHGIMSPIPPIIHSSNVVSRGPDSADRGFGTPKKYSIEQVEQLIENEQGLVDENDHLKQEVSSLREFIYRLENEMKEQAQKGKNNEKNLVEENVSLKNETEQLKETVAKLEKELRKQQAPQTQALVNEHSQIKVDVTNLQETDKNTTFETTNKHVNSLTQLQEENSRLKEELKQKENTIVLINKEGETLKTELDRVLKRLNTEDDYKSQRGEESYVLKDSVLGEEAPKSHRRTESGNLIREEDNSKILRERNMTPSIKNLGEEVSKSFREDGRMTQPELLRKQLGEYKAANAILHRKTERYLTQIGDLNEALKLANENLDKIQNRCITLEKELVNKNKLESIITSHISLINKLEVMINSLTEDNVLLQKANEENMIMITELKAQLQDTGAQDRSEGGRFCTPPRSGRRRLSSEPSEHSEVGEKANHSARSPPRSPDSMLLERDFIKKKYEEKLKAALHEKEVEMRTERIKHKNQIEKYNTNLEILSKKIKSLVTVNDNLGKDFELLKIEFANYKNVSWAIVQEVRKCLDNFKKHDGSIEKGLLALENAHGELATGEIKEAYEALRSDILDVNEVIEERRKYL